MRTLNLRQEAFARAYALNANATEAARTAGYSAHTAYAQGSRLLKDAEIMRRIAELITDTNERAVVSKEWVIAQLVTVYRKSLDGEPKVLRDGSIATDDEGKVIMEWSPTGANKALELLGRHLAMFTDRAEMVVTVEQALSVVDAAIADLEPRLAENDPVGL